MGQTGASALAAALALSAAAAAPAAAAPLDLRALWDFARPDVSEQRFRERLAGGGPGQVRQPGAAAALIRSASPVQRRP